MNPSSTQDESAPMRVAVVGAGARAGTQIDILSTTGLGTPVGVWNRTASRGRAIADHLGIAQYDSVEALVRHTQPDLVSIATGPQGRADLVDEAVRGGARAILLEKPLAVHQSELERIREAAGDCFVVVNTQYPWIDHWRTVLASVSDGELGEVRSIEVSTGVDLLEQGPHLLSLAYALADAAALPRPTWVLAGVSSRNDDGVPADTVAVADLGPARLRLSAGAVAPPVPGEQVIFYQQQVTVTGTRGRVWVSLNQGLERWTESGVHREDTSWARDDRQSQTDFFRDLGHAVRDPERRATFPTRLSEVLTREAFLFACIRSASSGARVSLD
jgi:predicted dehydrogenase